MMFRLKYLENYSEKRNKVTYYEKLMYKEAQATMQS